MALVRRTMDSLRSAPIGPSGAATRPSRESQVLSPPIEHRHAFIRRERDAIFARQIRGAPMDASSGALAYACFRSHGHLPVTVDGAGAVPTSFFRMLCIPWNRSITRPSSRVGSCQ